MRILSFLLLILLGLACGRTEKNGMQMLKDKVLLSPMIYLTSRLQLLVKTGKDIFGLVPFAG